jgi:hypothetical protein
MGGAFTALADDGSGPFYNPGGMAFVARSQLSLSGSIYGLVNGRFGDALGDGHDFNYHSLNIFPTTTSAVWKVREDETGSADVLAACLFVPDALNIDDRDNVGLNTNALFYTEQVQTAWAGLSYAHRFGRWGLGVSGFTLIGTRLYELDFTFLANPDSTNTSNQFENITSRTDESTIGFVGAMGARWDVTDTFHVGAAVYSPAYGFGKRRSFIRGLASNGTLAAGQVQASNDLHATPSDPLRIQVGGAWSSGRLTLAADVIYLGPRDIVDDPDQPFFARHVSRRGVVNGAVGVEYVAADKFPVRGGLYTDFATSPDTNTTDGLENSRHINRFGGTASIGLRTEHTSTDIGLNVVAGTGEEVVPNNLDFTTAKVTSASQLFLYAFLATSYQF